MITNVTAFYKTCMPSTEVTLLGRLPSGQHSGTGNCWLTESRTCQLWDLQELEWVFFTWKFLLAYFASLYGCIWETWVMSAPAMLWTHPGAFRFVLNKDCIAGFSASSQLDLLEMLVCIIVGMNPFVLLLTSEGAVLACGCFGWGTKTWPFWLGFVPAVDTAGSVGWPALSMTEVLACMTEDFVKLTWCWNNTFWNEVDRTSNVVVGWQRNDGCFPFGEFNYSTVTLYTVVIGSGDSGTWIRVGRPWAPCTALSLVGVQKTTALEEQQVAVVFWNLLHQIALCLWVIALTLLEVHEW